MAGTIAGGQLAAKLNKQRYGDDFYQRVGRLGGIAHKTGPVGFATMSPEKRRACGIKGGKKGRRTPMIFPDRLERAILDYKAANHSEPQELRLPYRTYLAYKQWIGQPEHNWRYDAPLTYKGIYVKHKD